jgi:prevent-host-death family protein
MVKTTATMLKANLGKYMRAVKSGQEILITDRDQPVARLVAYRPKHAIPDPVIRYQPRDPTATTLGELTVKSIHYSGPSTTDLLHDDRARR